MIVISGALVLVALVLLIFGLISTGLGLVYASIVVSLLSAVFLGVGVFQRRNEDLGIVTGNGTGTGVGSVGPVRETTPAADEVTAVQPLVSAPAGSDAGIAADVDSEEYAEDADDDYDDYDEEYDENTVFVVDGRPRYHVDGCRYLNDKEAEPRSIAEAQNEGFTACGVCKPDQVIAGVLAAEPAPPSAASASAQQPAARGAARAAETVVVIPARGKFHRPECRFVRDATGTEEISKAAAKRQGYVACGSCKP